MIKIAILGFGVVGSGVADVIVNNSNGITKKAGRPISVGRILDLKDFPESPFADKFTKDFEDIINDPSINIVVECMGGLNPAYDFVKRSLLSGKSVVSSNKELIAEKGDELLQIAKDNNLNFLFEASVGGGIPVLRPIDQCLAANQVEVVSGILNGTTNFILEKMITDEMTFEDALKLAMDKGYAESDPTDDIEGHDTARKICILASLSFGYHVHPREVVTKGITDVSLEDISYAEASGGVIKLIGHANKRPDGKIDCFVAPMFLQNNTLLSEIHGVFNGVYIHGDIIGDVVFYGRGAGKYPTASAVVADVIDEAKHMHSRKMIFWEPSKENYVSNFDDIVGTFFIRVKTENIDETIDVLSKVFKKVHEIDNPNALKGEFGVIIEDVSRKQVLDEFGNINGAEIISKYRVADYKA